MGKKRIVLDTNIFISALGYDGAEREIVKKSLGNEYELYLSQEIIEEIIRVVDYPKFKFTLAQKDQLKLILSENCKIVHPLIKINLVSEDSSDNKFIECALAADADYLITGDKHLLKLKEVGKLKIKNAVQFLKLA